MCHRVVIEIFKIIPNTKAMASWKLRHILILKYFFMINLNWVIMLLSVLVSDPCFGLLDFTRDNGVIRVLVN